jgi:hypothetical protein
MHQQGTRHNGRELTSQISDEDFSKRRRGICRVIGLAIHYHDQHSGAISYGCIRVEAAAITRLEELPLGTPVVIRP